MTSTALEHVPVDDGAVPVHVAAGPAAGPGLIVIPSIFGAQDDLLATMRDLSTIGTTAVLDPFWREGGGAIAYERKDDAMARLATFDRQRCASDIGAVTSWLRPRTNGRLAALGICFGGPFVLLGVSDGTYAGGVTWHGSRMETVLDRVDPGAGTLRLHLGDVDPMTPPDTIETIRTHFADHPDCRIVVHPGADHGFSHEGDAWDPDAAAASLGDLRELLTGLA